ncbi:MAG: DUF349 domain-containing protein, partial [Bacteroidales bacterium]|nr:DUF349 domain-containing protein [Bacteroidales bacterium]
AKDEVVKDEATIDNATGKDEIKGENKITDDDSKEADQVEEKVSDYEGLSKDRLVELLEEAVLDPAINKIKTKVSFIKYAFLKIVKEEQEQNLKDSIDEGGDKPKFEPEEDPLNKRFNHAFEKYKHNKAKYLAEQEKLRKKNLKTKMTILEELRELINSEESLKKTYDEFKTLQERWKEIGMVPKNEVNNLWQSYHFLVEKFFDRVKINKELKDLDLKKNLEKKIELCEKAEELLLETSITISFKKLQKYHEEWKEIGSVQQDLKDEIWERFKNATDKINERRREYYKKIRDNQETNYQAKLALCEKTEEIIRDKNQNIKDWQGHTDEMNELLKLWKSIGPVPRKYNTAIWERFKSALDTFFSDKKDYYGEIKDQQVNNYNLKLELCIQAEALKESSDWKMTTQQLINLQKEWKNIGPVPRKHSNRIWKRFRAACDEFFNRKAEYFANIHKHEDENLKLKKDLIEQVNNWKFSDVKKENLDIIKGFQRDWMGIGHVPIKEKDNLHNEFRSAINKHYDKLNIDALEISSLNYKTKLESVKKSPDGYKILKRERGQFSNKLSQMREDIMLWENNIGFLADSKNAQILKIEFEKKIDNAKKELIILEAKLRILNEQNI